MKVIIRKEAKSLKLTRYFTGKPCKHGHVAQRNVTSGACYSCIKVANEKRVDANKKWRVDNKERKSFLDKQYQEDNKEKLQQQRKQYHIDNAETINARSHNHYRDNKEQYAENAKIYVENNREHMLDYWRQQYQEHREQRLAQGKQWKRDNPDLVASYTERKVKYLKEYQPKWFDRKQVQQLYQKRDELNAKWNTKFQVDHIIPLQGKNVCGLHCWDNLQLLEQSDNSSKGTNYTSDW